MNKDMIAAKRLWVTYLILIYELNIMLVGKYDEIKDS